MRTTTTLVIVFITSVISNLSAQEKSWNDIYDFEMTSFNDSTMIKSKFGSRSIYTKNGEAIYHSMYINRSDIKDSVENIIIGKVFDYSYTKKLISLVKNDSSITQYDVEFKWICNFKNGIKDTATVKQLFFNSNETAYSILVERVDFNNGSSFFSWGGREPYNANKDETKLTLPVMLRIKRITTSDDYKDDLKNPDEIVTYAEWTDKGFYRYSVTGEKDSLVFGGPAKRKNVTKGFEAVSFDSDNGDSFIFSNFYLNAEPHYYVSTMDMYQFPYEGGELDSYNGTLESKIWEKMNLNLEFTKTIMKLKLIGENMMLDSEYELLRNKFSLLLKFAKDSDFRKSI